MAAQGETAENEVWSLRQVSKSARIGMRTARTLVAGNWLPSEGLSRNHVFVARVTAALFDAPRSPDEGRGALSPMTVARYRGIIADLYDLLLHPQPAAVLLLAPDTHLIANDLLTALPFFSREGAVRPVLVLPVGAWAQEVVDGR